MRLVNTQSLAATVDAIGEAFFLGRQLPKTQRRGAADWIAARLGKPGSYAGMFSPTRRDFDRGIKLFTGESIATGAGIAHILGEEACRALILLDIGGAKVRDALATACAEMIRKMRLGRDRASGTYCCGKCTVSLWRHLAVGGLENNEALLAAGMKTLKSCRERAKPGRWGHYPFYYTLLALSEIDTPAATAEMRYAAPPCERLLRRSPREGRFDARRRIVAERILAKC